VTPAHVNQPADSVSPPASDTPDDRELTDDELKNVAGGLEVAWVPDTESATAHDA